jgi:hypothetical protein
MSFEHIHGRGSDANGIHFYQIIQLRQLQDQELVSINNSTSSHSCFCFLSSSIFFLVCLSFVVNVFVEMPQQKTLHTCFMIYVFVSAFMFQLPYVNLVFLLISNFEAPIKIWIGKQ